MKSTLAELRDSTGCTSQVVCLGCAGETLRLKVCNNLTGYEADAISSLNDTFATPVAPMEVNHTRKMMLCRKSYAEL